MDTRAARKVSARVRTARKNEAVKIIRADAAKLFGQNPKLTLDDVSEKLEALIAKSSYRDMLNATYRASTIKRFIKGVKSSVSKGQK